MCRSVRFFRTTGMGAPILMAREIRTLEGNRAENKRIKIPKIKILRPNNFNNLIVSMLIRSTVDRRPSTECKSYSITKSNGMRVCVIPNSCFTLFKAEYVLRPSAPSSSLIALFFAFSRKSSKYLSNNPRGSGYSRNL